MVEDEKKVASFIKRGLQEEQYEVQVAYDGEAGLKLAQGSLFDLVVLDWLLPNVSGLALLKGLREKGITTPVLMLTAKDSLQDIVTGLDSGCDDYLTKPFAFPVLGARVRALLRRGGQEKGAEVRYSDVRLDPVTHRVWRGDKEIEMTSKEYELMEYFMRHPDQVLTRNMIAENCWDYTFDSFTNIIDVYVNYLRKKLDREFHTKLINTVRGVGYVFKEEAK